MPEGAPFPAIEAGRQTRAHLQLSRYLWFRQRGKPYRFLFDLAADPSLTLEPVGHNGEGLSSRIAEAHAERRALDYGALLIDDNHRLLFCTASDPGDFLRRIAAWARQTIPSIPALAILANAGAAKMTTEMHAIDPHALDVNRDPSLWSDLLRPDAATIAAALAATPPGERMWFWLTHIASEDAVPLIVQPLAWDPNHDPMGWLIARNRKLGASEGSTGTCSICDDGTVQFLGDGLHRVMLWALADWVDRYHQDYLALARLIDCRLLLTSETAVEEVYEDAALWAGMMRQPVPGTIAATAALLETLPVAGECWFWITGGSSEPAFLHLTRMDEDPEGAAFRAELPRLYNRFPRSFHNAISGVMTRLSADKLLFLTQDERSWPFPAQIQSLLDRYAVEFPSLRSLAGTSLVRAGAEGQYRMVPAAAAAA
jgi:hypothetical protein